MITVTVQNNHNYADLPLPCSDGEMQKKLEKLDRRDETNYILYLEKVTEPEELSVLQDRFVDLDELNYLAKRMDSFDRREKKQFFAAASHCGFRQVKDLINLTFNLSRFTLIQDLSNMEAVGRLHQLTLSGGLGEEEMEPADFAEIGKELLESGRGKITEYGILFINEEIPFDEVYDGQVFPEYYHEECLCTAMIGFGEKTEYAYLPCDEQAIEKALMRLGCSDSFYDSVMLINFSMGNGEWENRFEKVLADEGVFAVNELASAVNSLRTSEEWNKLSAVADLVAADDSRSLMVLAENLESFVFIPEVQDQEDLARYWIRESTEYDIHPDLEDYFLYEQFGEQLQNDIEGMFLPGGGYVYLEDGQSLDELLQDKENMIMGGM